MEPNDFWIDGRLKDRDFFQDYVIGGVMGKYGAQFHFHSLQSKFDSILKSYTNWGGNYWQEGLSILI